MRSFKRLELLSFEIKSIVCMSSWFSSVPSDWVAGAVSDYNKVILVSDSNSMNYLIIKLLTIMLR